MLKPFIDHYTVTELQKVNLGTFNAHVTFRSMTQPGKNISRLRLHADDLSVWVEVSPDEDALNPDTALRFLDKSPWERVRLGCNYALKQKALRLAACRYLRLPPDDFEDNHSNFRRSRTWKTCKHLVNPSGA
jgi:hypothetical protein